MAEREFTYHGTHEQLREHVSMLDQLGLGLVSSTRTSSGIFLDHDPRLESIGIANDLGKIAIEAGAEEQRLTLACPDLAWPHVAPKWEGLTAELGRQGGTAAAPEPRRKTRGTSKETDANAREALRLYNDEELTQEAIAERKSVSVKTVKRWLKRAREAQDKTA